MSFLHQDKTALSYWFPKIEAAGVPVPKTKIIEMPDAAQKDVWAVFDGKPSGDALKKFADEIASEAIAIGLPCFLRTDHTSGKHDWERTCFLERAEDVTAHIIAIVEFSECCDLRGLPWGMWAVRELLPTIQFGKCPNYVNMPVSREFRFFARHGEIICFHPYWPLNALIKGGADVSRYDEMCELRASEYELVSPIVVKAAKAVDGLWSIDVIETERGWFVTDMAEANRSFHWEGCESWNWANL